jgi:glucokinase
MASKKKFAVGVDLGGTSMRAAMVDSEGKVLCESEDKTHPEEGMDGVLERLLKLIERSIKDADIKKSYLTGVGIGIPGGVDSHRGHVHQAPNLGWENVHLTPRLKKALDLPVFLDNDVNVAILGEFHFGAAKKARSALGVWVGTGIGGGIILDGKVLRGLHGAAAEIGHSILLPDGPVCGCGNRGCVEALASRTAMEREIRRRIERGEESIIPALLKRSGKERITSGILSKAIRKEDHVTREVMAETQRYLGMAIATWINILDPEILVLGGGVAEKFGNAYLKPIETEARRHMFKTQGKPTRFELAELADWSGVLGAAALAL